MDLKFPLVSPFNYNYSNLRMSVHLNWNCLFEVYIGALSKPESYEENIDWINNCDRAYGVMCLAMSPNIHHLIDSTEYPFELWKNLEKAFHL